jgi:hypothetical protein
MLSTYWLTVPFVLQTLSMAADEFLFHRRRGLPRWERVGHPIDTLSVLVCYGWLFLAAPGGRAALVYSVLAAASCLLVTKDEPVHRRLCDGAEQWLHAVLFLLHPLVLLAAALLWPALHGTEAALPWIRYAGWERAFLLAAAAAAASFGAYQFIYWNVLCPSLATGSTTASTTTSTNS